MFDYEWLRLFTWGAIGVLLIGFIITDGFDMGVAALLPIIGKNNDERRVMINTVAPHWDGNQVWLITAGGAIFAIWPTAYAVSFSGFYIAMMLALATLWLRPVSFEYRAKVDSPVWRNRCDLGLVISGIVPPIIFGVGFGNLLAGVPFDLNHLLMIHYSGSFWELLTVFPLVCGVLALFMALSQGSVFLQLKTTGDIRERSQKVAMVCSMVCAVLFITGGIFAANMNGYIITSEVITNLPSNPLHKEVASVANGLLHNYSEHHLLYIIPMFGIVMYLLTAVLSYVRSSGFAFLTSSLAMACVILTAGIALFPMIIPSSINPDHSLTIWDATSNELTLQIISAVVVLVVPVILGYTAWCYSKMFGRIDTDYVKENSARLY